MNRFSFPPPPFDICCSVTQLCPTLCDLMDCSTPDSPVLHHLLELAQTHVHGVSDAIQLSHPLSSPSPSAFSLSQHQDIVRGLFWGGIVGGSGRVKLLTVYMHLFWDKIFLSQQSSLVPLSVNSLTLTPDSGNYWHDFSIFSFVFSALSHKWDHT